MIADRAHASASSVADFRGLAQDIKLGERASIEFIGGLAR
jgi:hypothetical protein